LPRRCSLNASVAACSCVAASFIVTPGCDDRSIMLKKALRHPYAEGASRSG
jgi:hypothetical protein